MLMARDPHARSSTASSPRSSPVCRSRPRTASPWPLVRNTRRPSGVSASMPCGFADCNAGSVRSGWPGSWSRSSYRPVGYASMKFGAEMKRTSASGTTSLRQADRPSLGRRRWKSQPHSGHRQGRVGSDRPGAPAAALDGRVAAQVAVAAAADRHAAALQVAPDPDHGDDQCQQRQTGQPAARVLSSTARVVVLVRAGTDGPPDQHGPRCTARWQMSRMRALQA